MKAVLRRLPGKARPQAEALREYEAGYRRYEPGVLRDLFIARPDQVYRWRVQLDCGCIKEVLTKGDQDLPADRRWKDGHGRPLPAGQMICVEHKDDRPTPYREIVEWKSKRLHERPPDPFDAPDWWSGDPEAWANRHDKPRTSAFWTVTLACGHPDEVCVGDVDWKPGDEPHRVSPERQAELRIEWAAYLAGHPPESERDKQEQEHDRRYIEQGCPRPDPEDHCQSCLWARSIVAYQRVGWLVPRKKTENEAAPVPSTPQPSRAALEKQLRKAEAEADQLRNALARLGEQPIKQEEET